MATVTRTTLEAFLADPSIDEQRLELIDGEVYEKPMPNWGHARIANVLGTILDDFGEAGAEPRAVIGQTASFDASSPLPDLAFYRDHAPESDEWMTRPPHVAVEVLSPGQSRRDMRAKVELYLAFGIESVWVIDPVAHTIEVYEEEVRNLFTEGDTLATPAVPGLALDLAAFFKRCRVS